MIDTWQGIGSATARVACPGSAFDGATLEIAAYAEHTVLLAAPAFTLPFGLGEVDVLGLSKSASATIERLDKTDSGTRMRTFLKLLSEWAEMNGTAGKVIRPDPDAGPGTMYWRAE